MNLDSVSWAPSDSAFKARPHPQHVDSLPPDSLSSAIGNVYVIKTGRDPRPIYDYPLYAKIKLLDFTVIDAAAHEVEMVFLWACQLSGSRDIATQGLDTFDLATPVLAEGRGVAPSPRPAAARRAGPVVRLQHNGRRGAGVVVVRQEAGGVGRVFDLRGRVVGRNGTAEPQNVEQMNVEVKP
jgi:hypothetical protein